PGRPPPPPPPRRRPGRTPPTSTPTCSPARSRAWAGPGTCWWPSRPAAAPRTCCGRRRRAGPTAWPGAAYAAASTQTDTADIALHVDGHVAGLVQQGHITIGHALCGWVERRLAGL